MIHLWYQTHLLHVCNPYSISGGSCYGPSLQVRRLRSINNLWHTKGAIGRWVSHSSNLKLPPKVHLYVILLSTWSYTEAEVWVLCIVCWKGWEWREPWPLESDKNTVLLNCGKVWKEFYKYSIKARTHPQKTNPGRSEILKSVPRNECVNLTKRQGHRGTPQGHWVL